jgi:hypothetical protein
LWQPKVYALFSAQVPAHVPTLEANLIPLTGFLRQAERRGWHFRELPTPSPDSEAPAICARLREDAFHGKLTFYGVQKKWDSDLVLRKEPREKIPSVHWCDFEIDCSSCFDLDSRQEGRIMRVASDNWQTRTSTQHIRRVKENEYVNLHLLRAEVDPWLASVEGGGGHLDRTVQPLRLDHNDYEKWDDTDELKLWEAACLWANEKPAMPLSRRATQAFRLLEKAINDDRLDARRADLNEVLRDAWDQHVNGTTSKANPNWVVTKSDLVSFARASDKKPPFLFPKERT